MKRGKEFFCCVFAMMVFLLTGCSHNNNAFSDDSIYQFAPTNLFAGDSAFANERNTNNIHSDISIEQIVYSDDFTLAVDNSICNMGQLLESNKFYAVRFLPERVYNPDNIFPFRAVSLESLKSMYRELNEQFDYTLMIPFGLGYIGNFDRDVNFVEMPPNANISDFVNRPNGNGETITPIKAIGLGRTLYQGFDGGILEGRNLISTDFYKNSPEQAISVVLGYAYKEIYNVGDTFQLQMNWQTLDFTIVGFFQQGIGINNSGIGLGDGTFDHTIVMPLFSIGYEPTDDNNLLFQTFR